MQGDVYTHISNGASGFLFFFHTTLRVQRGCKMPTTVPNSKRDFFFFCTPFFSCKFHTTTACVIWLQQLFSLISNGRRYSNVYLWRIDNFFAFFFTRRLYFIIVNSLKWGFIFISKNLFLFYFSKFDEIFCILLVANSALQI